MTKSANCLFEVAAKDFRGTAKGPFVTLSRAEQLFRPLPLIITTDFLKERATIKSMIWNLPRSTLPFIFLPRSQNLAMHSSDEV